jgi:Bacterial SH3 domain
MVSGIAKFCLGFFLAIFILVGGAVGVAYYLFTKMSVNPPKPIFAEEQKQSSPIAKPVSLPTGAKSKQDKKATPTPSESPTTKELPPGAYKARVSWPEGLSIRDQPNLDSNRVNGVAYNQEVFVLQESDDKRWQKIRIIEGGEEGWIKAGNIEKVDATTESPQSTESPQ